MRTVTPPPNVLTGRIATPAPADLGIEILVRLARDGEVDPWDIDVIDVTDRYLQAIAGLEVTDLVASAKLIFYAAVLLHLKAQLLARGTIDLSILDDPDAAELPDDLAAELEELGPNKPRSAILRPGERLSLEPRNRLPRTRTVTLGDLITALRTYEDRLNAPPPEVEIDEFGDDLPFVGDELDIGAACLDSGHREDPDAEREAVEGQLGLPGVPGEIFDFERLSRGLAPHGFTRAAVYLALLFLASRGQIDLEQESIYDDGLEVVVRDPDAEELDDGFGDEPEVAVEAAGDETPVVIVDESVDESNDGSKGGS